MCIYNIISYYCKGPSQIDNPRISKFISVHFMMLMLHGSFILCLLVGWFVWRECHVSYSLDYIDCLLLRSSRAENRTAADLN